MTEQPTDNSQQTTAEKNETITNNQRAYMAHRFGDNRNILAQNKLKIFWLTGLVINRVGMCK